MTTLDTTPTPVPPLIPEDDNPPKVYAPECGMTISEYAQMWDVPVWKAQARVNDLVRKRVAREIEDLVDDHSVTSYVIDVEALISLPL